jgi:hypothetical protein
MPPSGRARSASTEFRFIQCIRGDPAVRKTLLSSWIVAFAGYDKLKADAEYLGKLTGNPMIAQGLDAALKQATQGDGLAGVDTSKPWGAQIFAEEGKPHFVAFVPVSDVGKLMGLLGKFGLEPKDAADGVKELETPGQSLFLKDSGGWLFVADEAAVLKQAPADPVAALAGLQNKYEVSARASVKNLPDEWKQQVLGLLQMGAMFAAQNPDAADAAAMLQQSIQQITTLMNELDEVVVGFGLDQTAGSAVWDINITALPGTKTAQSFAALADTKTDFAGLNVPGAAVTMQFAQKMSADDIKQAKTSMGFYRKRILAAVTEQDLDETDKKAAEQIVGDLFDVLDKTLDGGKMDGGLAMILNPTAATMVFGGLVVDAPKLEKILKTLVADVAKQQPDLAKLIKFDAETHEGVRFHTAAIPVPDEPDTKAFFAAAGNPLELVVGAGDQALYVAVGRDAAKTLKQVITASKAAPGTAIPPSRLSVAGGAIAKFVAAMAADEPEVKQVAEMLAQLLAQSPGKDHLTITAKAVPNGSTTRIEIEQGLLKAIPMAIMTGMGMAAPAGAAPPGGAF